MYKNQHVCEYYAVYSKDIVLIEVIPGSTPSLYLYFMNPGTIALYLSFV